MADIIAHPRAQSERVIQTRIRGRLPNSIPSIRTIRRNQRYEQYKANVLQDEIATTLRAAAEWEQVGVALRLKAESLKQQAKGVQP